MSEDDGLGKDRVVDLRSQKTESEWAYFAQALLETATPLWFKWMSWLFVTGALKFIAHSTNIIALMVLYKISNVLIFLYFTYFIASIRVEPFHSWFYARMQKKGRIAKILYNTPSLVFAITTSLIITYILNDAIDHLHMNK